jgi:hypothetical protein
MWEYKVIRMADVDPEASWDAVTDLYGVQLTGAGRDGWELVTLLAMGSLPWAVYRRESGTKEDGGP